MRPIQLALLITALAARSAGAADAPAIHGMLVAGTGGGGSVFLSHLPMFHSPHDYQVIAEAAFESASAMSAYAAARAQSKEKIYTFVPRPFSLPELASGKTSVTGDVYQGHFERGGTRILVAARMKILKLLHFRKLDAKSPHPATLEYLLFGNGTEQFLAHRIAGRPDFDQVLSVAAPAAEGVKSVVFPGTSQNTPLKGGEKLTGTLEGSGAPVEIETATELYFEEGDLS